MGFKKYGPSRNLFDINATDINNGYDNTGRYLTNTGTTGGNAGGTWRISEYITIEPNSEYRLSGFTTGVNPSYCLYDVNKDFISGTRYGSESVLAITTPSNARYLRFSRNINTDDVTMLNSGSTPLPYEPYGNIWQPITPKKLKGIPYSGTLPATLTGTKTGYLHRYKIYGNTEQTGTPTPENPIVPSECGERTENIIDGYLEQAYISLSAQGVVSSYNGIDLALFPIEQGSTYTIQRFVTYMELYVGFFASKPQIGSVTYDQTIHAPTPAVAATFTFVAPITGWAAVRSTRATLPKATVCVVKGSTAPTSYIPYGYKLPLTSAGQSVDIYLGESQTTRRIGKFDLSQATWRATDTPGLLRTTDIPNIKYASSNLELGNGLAEKYQIHSGSGMSSALNCIAIDVSQVSVNTGDNSIKPTGMFYYALATPEIAVVNEPLRKIGDYADTIDSTQTSAQIPTTAGSTTISWAGEGLAPSQFDSVQEWVDIPTYTYTNGEWVADN